MEQREDNKNDIATRRLKNLFGEALRVALTCEGGICYAAGNNISLGDCIKLRTKNR